MKRYSGLVSILVMSGNWTQNGIWWSSDEQGIIRWCQKISIAYQEYLKDRIKQTTDYIILITITIALAYIQDAMQGTRDK